LIRKERPINGPDIIENFKELFRQNGMYYDRFKEMLKKENNQSEVIREANWLCLLRKQPGTPEIQYFILSFWGKPLLHFLLKIDLDLNLSSLGT
jgi:hypothetical protein